MELNSATTVANCTHNFVIDDLPSIIEGILTYHRSALYSSWQALELQQEQLNETTNPELYIELDRANWILHNSWLQFRR